MFEVDCKITKYLRITLVTLLLLMCMAGCHKRQQESNVTLRVKIRESRGETIYLKKVTLDGTETLDSGKVDQQGEVSYALFTNDFEFLMLDNGRDKQILLLAGKDESIEVFTRSGEFGDEYTVQGSGGSELLLMMEQKRQQIGRELDSIGKLWLQDRYSAENLEKRALFDSVSEASIQAYKEKIINLIRRYPQSPAMIIAAYQVVKPGIPLFTLEDDLKVFREISGSLHQLYPDNVHVKDFRRRTLEFEEERKTYLEREKKLRPGMPVPSTELFNTRGEKIAISSLLGKYVLIYFWDARKEESWEINRKLLSLHPQYKHRGFEVYAIYTGDDKQLLYNAISIDRLPWVQLFSNSMTEKQFNVREVPVMMLVDREGAVLHRTITIDQLAARLPWLLPERQPVKLNGTRNDTPQSRPVQNP